MRIVSAPKIPSEEIFSLAREFLLLHEKKCVSLVERIFRHEVRFFLILGEPDDVGQEKVEGIFSYSDGGQILHCLCGAEENRDAYVRALSDFFSSFSQEEEFSKLFSIIGESVGTRIIEDSVFEATGILPLFSEDTYFYELGSAFDGRDFISDSVPIARKMLSAEICRAGLDFFEELKPIQKSYEEEEVLFEGQPFNPAVSSFLLKKAISAESVYIAVSGGKIVGKAALNAVGEKYVQIGGVFTVPEFRGRGIAKALVEKIICEKTGEGKKIVLFAKTKNLPAQKLYESCGFNRFGGFKICYYRNG